MPYSPSERFDPSMIFRGITGAGDALGGGIQEAIKKKEHAEAQMAGSMFGFETLKKAGLIDPEEETKFLQGNANQRNAIVMAATPRLLQQFKTQQERNEMAKAKMQRDLQLRIAQMHYGGPDGPDGMTPYQREQTRLREMDILRKQQHQQVIPRESRAVARGRLKADGTFDNNYKGAESGDMAQIRKPDGTMIIAPYSDYQASTGMTPAQPQAAAAPVPSTTSIIEKNGHHYEVDHASKKVLRQID